MISFNPEIELRLAKQRQQELIDRAANYRLARSLSGSRPRRFDAQAWLRSRLKAFRHLVGTAPKATGRPAVDAG